MGEKKEVDNKKNEGEKKNDGGGQNTVVLKFDMHCEGCAKKVRKSIKKSQGVESVKTDCATGKLTVVGDVDPVTIKEKVEEKMKKKVELVSMQPNKPSTNKEGGGEKKPDEKKSEVKSDDKKEEKKDEKKGIKVEKPKEPQVATVLLKTRVHCEGCAQKIKKIVGKCDGVQDVNVDLQKDMITLKGTMHMKDLLPYLKVKLKRNVELAPAKKDEGAGGGDKKPKEGGGGGGGSKDKAKEGGGGGGGATEKPKEGGGGGGGGSTEKPAKGGGDKKDGGKEKKEGGEGNASNENVTKIEVNKMEYNPYAYGYGAQAYTYDPRQQGQTSYGYSHQVVDYWHEPEFSNPPQMFSDENPNACSVM